ncbi:sortase family protein [Streptomyces sp. TLI_235]|nr:class F sortase [Streptomyces sp. TLI_235]PBC71871.1 sortase family protein [Streptomyces sp. TLI_235]
MRRPPTRGARAALAAAAAFATAGAWLVHDGTRTQSPPVPAAADARPAAAAAAATAADRPTPAAAARAAAGMPAAMPFSLPTRLRIPAIGVDAPVTGVGLDTRGGLQVPPEADRNLAGWYRLGAAPGSAGNALLVGHVDTDRGRAVFWSLGSLHRGNTLDVLRADGSTARFAVDAVEVLPKDGFPDDRVYGATARPELRVITCGGGYTRATGYLGNVVVYAHLVQAL